MASEPKQPEANKRSGNPARRAGAAGAPGRAPVPSREALESKSWRALFLLNRVPRWLLLGIVLALLLGGLFISGIVGGILLLVLAGFIGWLLAVSWPVLTSQQRLLRSFVVVLVVGSAVFQALKH